MTNKVAAQPAISVRYERAAADFPDGSSLRLEENELSNILTRRRRTGFKYPEASWVGDELDLDAENNYLLIGLHWADTSTGLVMLPEAITRENPSTTEHESFVLDYDRVAYIDAAIETLQRAKAVLTMKAAAVA